MLIDEFDQLMNKTRELVGILNSAHKRTGRVVRTVEVQKGGIKDFEPRGFSTFSPILLAGIGVAPATIADRSITFPLQRQPRARRRHRIGDRNLQGLRNQLAPHMMAHADALGAAMAKGVPDSAIPANLTDRAADNWRPLLAVAALAGGTWPARAYKAATFLYGGAVGERDSEWVLSQIVEAVDEKRRANVDNYLEWRRQGRTTINPVAGRKGLHRGEVFKFFPSDELAGWLLNKDDSGFSDLRDLGTVKLRVANKLRPFGIKPTQLRIGGAPSRGYDVASVRAAWRRYRP